MKEKLRAFWQKDWVRFIARTVFYFVVLFALVYMFSYSGLTQPHLFIRILNRRDVEMEANLIAQIDQFAVSHPDKSAYDYLGPENTYGDLKKYTDALADYILKMDLPAKAPIVVFGGQTFEMIAAFLGVVKSGHS